MCPEVWQCLSIYSKFEFSFQISVKYCLNTPLWSPIINLGKRQRQPAVQLTWRTGVENSRAPPGLCNIDFQNNNFVKVVRGCQYLHQSIFGTYWTASKRNFSKILTTARARPSRCPRPRRWGWWLCWGSWSSQEWSFLKVSFSLLLSIVIGVI